MNRWIYLSMIAITALCAVSCKKHEDPVKTGFIADYPYTTKEAVEAVSGLSWTSNTEYETTGVVYVKGRKCVTGPDIEEGDTVIIRGKLMNYRGNTPETVALEAHLFALN